MDRVSLVAVGEIVVITTDRHRPQGAPVNRRELDVARQIIRLRPNRLATAIDRTDPAFRVIARDQVDGHIVRRLITQTDREKRRRA